MNTEKYRPSNGTEGDCFMSRFCFQCARHSEEDPCEILGDALTYAVTDKSYPEEWQNTPHGPTCTAFITDNHDAPPPRCDQTSDMLEQLCA